MICAIANKRKTTIEELQKLTNLNSDVINTALKNGTSKKMIKQIRNGSTSYYTLTPLGERHLETTSSMIVTAWTTINNAINNKDNDKFVKAVQENEAAIKYLRYTKMVDADDADFILNTYNDILQSRKKKKRDLELNRVMTDAEVKRTNALREQQWKFDDQNYEITREYNEYVDTHYYDTYNDNYY